MTAGRGAAAARPGRTRLVGFVQFKSRRVTESMTPTANVFAGPETCGARVVHIKPYTYINQYGIRTLVSTVGDTLCG